MSFVREHRDRVGVEPILWVLEVPVSTFYGWLAQQRRPCQRRRRDAWLLHKIRVVHTRSGGTHGRPGCMRSCAATGSGSPLSGRVRLMGAHGLQGAFLRKRWRCSTRQDPKATPAPDLVDRNFHAEAPNRLWVADISRIGTGEGRCGWPVSATPARGGSWAGRPATEPTSSWCWARWSRPSGVAAWTAPVILPSVG